MDPHLLRHYIATLGHTREVGAEFAAAFPRIAARLGMDGTQVSDPFVERLLEGFAFQAARVQLKLDAEQPRLIAHLLEALYPNFLAPVPSMMIARYGVDVHNPNLASGPVVPRGSSIQSTVARGQGTHCEFRSAHAVTLWPISLVDVRYSSQATDLPPARLPQAQAARGVLRLRLRCGGGLRFNQLGLDRLALYISAADDVAFRLHALLTTALAGTVVLGKASANATDATPAWQGPHSLRPMGFAADEALLPDTLRGFSGFRLLQEMAALPQRLLFFEITHLAARLARVACDEVELVVLLNKADGGLEPLVDERSLALFCTPAINLFEKRLDRIQLGPGSWEYHAVPDRARPMDFEVHSICSVTGHGSSGAVQQQFAPLYNSLHDDRPVARSRPHGYYTVRREPRLLSAREQQQGPRSSQAGEEVYLMLTDPHHAPHHGDVRQLSVLAWVSNRDLPNLLPPVPEVSAAQTGQLAAPPAWRLESPGPVLQVSAQHQPTRPCTRRPVGEPGWDLVNHLTLNHQALIGATPQHGAAMLRQMLGLYAPPDDPGWQRQIEGVLGLQASTAVHRLPFKGPLTFGTGVAIVLELDELAFQGSSALLLASVLDCFFARHAAINSFTQLTLRTPQRGELMRWPPRLGLQEVV